MTQIDKIKAEIEWLKEECNNSNFYLDNSEQALGYMSALDDLLSFIESLEKEEAREVTSRHKQTQGCRGPSQVVEDKDTNNTIILQPQGLDEAAEEYRQ